MGKRRPFGSLGFDEDFFAEFDKIEEMMREMMESHFGELQKGDLHDLGKFKPMVYGFTLEFGPEGKAKLTEFGKNRPVGRVVQKHGEKDVFMDVINNKDDLTIVAELPGVVEEHLHLKAFPKQLGIRVSDPNRLLSKTFGLPAEVDEGSLKYSLKNGILEVVLKKKKK
ncbi:MAG: Hsp20/alpha crystallin family protein [Candidatus Micrarchaeota archaeon]